MGCGFGAELGATVSKNADDVHTLFFHERQHTIFEQIGRGDRGLDAGELGCSPLRIGIDVGLLVDTADSLDCANL